MVRAIRLGQEIKIGNTTIVLKEIDPHGKWVLLKINSSEHAVIRKAQQEPVTR